jgi:tRNA-splicing ligase RtcB
MRAKEFVDLGIPSDSVGVAGKVFGALLKAGKSQAEAIGSLVLVVKNPKQYGADPILSVLATNLMEHKPPQYIARTELAPSKIWGTEIDQASKDQMNDACRLPISVRGALMPDAHKGYGLPIGGVLATRNAVIPFAVGMDIACRMRMSVFNLDPELLVKMRGLFVRALEENTRFGVNCEFGHQQHPVMDENWGITKVTKELKDQAWVQLGTSGSGNHFVEFGEIFGYGASVETNSMHPELPFYGFRIALLSHSGSRGTGAKIAKHYSDLATKLNPSLPKELQHLAWLDLSTEEGQEYWQAMQLMGRYAAANHEIIHRLIAKAIGIEPFVAIENHHNFAWEEEYDGEKLIVHRKGATPAGKGIVGIIPGSMGTPAFIAQGLGNPLSLNSASHGAGRRMSRTEAKKQFTWEETKKFLSNAGVELLSAGLDECPMAYKDINSVMEAQRDLVESIGKFEPRLVKMAPGSEPAED